MPIKQLRCGCWEKMNEWLEQHNTAIVGQCVANRAGEEGLRMEIFTEKIDPKVRKRKKVVLAHFCPFCGQEES